MQIQMKGGETTLNQHCPAKFVPIALNTQLKGEIPVASNKKGSIQLNMTEEEQKQLKDAGIWLRPVVLDEESYSLTRTGQICDISLPWLRKQLQDGKISAFKNERKHWRVKREVVAQVWQREKEKLLDRLNRPEDGKGYIYRRPTEWAYHLIVRYINEPGKVSATEKKHVKAVIERAKIDWEANYQARLAKKEANKAEKEKAGQK